MSFRPRLAAVLLPPALLSLLLLGGCTCGFDCNSDDDDGPGVLTLGFSDSLPEDLAQVNLNVDRITLTRGAGAEDVVIERFTIPGLGLTNVDAFTVNLLRFRGARQLVVVDALEVPAVSYRGIVIESPAGDSNLSSVLEDSGEQKTLRLDGGRLELPGFTQPPGARGITVEFELARSLRYDASAGRYLLDTTGMRVADSVRSATLSGRVDPALFDATIACSEKTAPTEGNRVYLYQGRGLAAASLADVFRDTSATDIPPGSIAPYAVGEILENEDAGSWEYAFGYLPAGDYTLVFGCDTAADDTVDYDGPVLPQPASQRYEFTLETGTSSACNLDDDASC